MPSVSAGSISCLMSFLCCVGTVCDVMDWKRSILLNTQKQPTPGKLPVLAVVYCMAGWFSRGVIPFFVRSPDWEYAGRTSGRGRLRWFPCRGGSGSGHIASPEPPPWSRRCQSRPGSRILASDKKTGNQLLTVFIKQCRNRFPVIYSISKSGGTSSWWGTGRPFFFRWRTHSVSRYSI